MSKRTPPVPARTVAAQRPPLDGNPLRGTETAPAADPGNDVLPSDRSRARSGTEPDAGVVNLPVERVVSHVGADGSRWVASAARLTPDEIEAIAQRLAALLLRAP